jgi:hypothetical protein
MASAQADTRPSFTVPFLRGAVLFTHRAWDIEAGPTPSADLDLQHRAQVAGAVIQSVAAPEAEIFEVAVYGPGHHQGSNGIDQEGLKRLRPLARAIKAETRTPVLCQYEQALCLLETKTEMLRGDPPYQDAHALVRLRNSLVHYQSRWSTDEAVTKLLAHFERYHLKPPPFRPSTSTPLLLLLGASCASWAVLSSRTFVDTFYRILGITNPLTAYDPVLSVPPP